MSCGETSRRLIYVHLESVKEKEEVVDKGKGKAYDEIIIENFLDLSITIN